LARKILYKKKAFTIFCEEAELSASPVKSFLIKDYRQSCFEKNSKGKKV
jgi:hypothetical protein